MKKLIIFLTILFCFSFLSSPKANATYPFDLIPMDKYVHLLACAYATEYAQNQKLSSGNILISVGTIGLLKEVYDKWGAGSIFDWSDVAADFAGIGIGLLIN